jgi:hypothetical protein
MARSLSANLTGVGGLVKRTATSLFGVVALSGSQMKVVFRLLSAALSVAGGLSITRFFMRYISGTIAASGAISKSVFARLSGLVSMSATLAVVAAGVDTFIGKTRLSGAWSKTTLIGTFHDSVKYLQGVFSSKKKLDGEL